MVRGNHEIKIFNFIVLNLVNPFGAAYLIMDGWKKKKKKKNTHTHTHLGWGYIAQDPKFV